MMILRKTGKTEYALELEDLEDLLRGAQILKGQTVIVHQNIRNSRNEELKKKDQPVVERTLLMKNVLCGFNERELQISGQTLKGERSQTIKLNKRIHFTSEKGLPDIEDQKSKKLLYMGLEVGRVVFYEVHMGRKKEVGAMYFSFKQVDFETFVKGPLMRKMRFFQRSYESTVYKCPTIFKGQLERWTQRIWTPIENDIQLDWRSYSFYRDRATQLIQSYDRCKAQHVSQRNALTQCILTENVERVWFTQGISSELFTLLQGIPLQKISYLHHDPRVLFLTPEGLCIKRYF